MSARVAPEERRIPSPPADFFLVRDDHLWEVGKLYRSRSRLRDVGQKLLDRVTELSKHLPRALSDPREISQFLQESDSLRQEIRRWLGWLDSPSYERVRQLTVWPWSGQVDKIDRELIIPHFDKCLSAWRETLQRELHLLPISAARPLE
jgi:hypothetical protein